MNVCEDLRLCDKIESQKGKRAVIPGPDSHIQIYKIDQYLQAFYDLF